MLYIYYFDYTALIILQSFRIYIILQTKQQINKQRNKEVIIKQTQKVSDNHILI